ncbi:MAG: sulfatase-like hydrolase/transferase [Myxococcales bacterium]|nr:sulfatase-like hydrolase/transferase [Myxococcales bacterium]
MTAGALVIERTRTGRVSLVALLLVVACSGRRKTDVAVVDAGPEVAPAPPPAREELLLDLLEPTPRCRLEHRGAFVDLGAPESAWATPGHPDASTELPSFERDGATWGRVVDRSQSWTLALDETGPALVALRGRARAAKKVSVAVDGKTVGTLALAANEDRVVTVSNPALTLTPGLHVLSLRWHGPVSKEEPLAELDWIRLGTVDGAATAYAAPTRRDTFAQVALGGSPRRAYSLMAPSTLRCVVVAPKGAWVAADVGAIGEGAGAVALRVKSLSADANTSVEKAATSAAWAPISSAPFATGGLVEVELAVLRGPKQGRVAVAEPRIVRAPTLAPPREEKKALSAVVIVLAGLSAREIDRMPVLARLAKEGTTFRAHRAPSHVAAGSFASLATGLPVPVHAVEDVGARLSQRTPLVGKRLGPFGVESAMFTEVPSTGAAFGFAHDWTSFAAKSPLDGAPVAFDELSKYVGAHAGKKSLLYLHARGAHPPWDISPEALKTLGPEGYSGPVDPKHAVAIIGRARKGLGKLNEADRARLEALRDAALLAQSKRLEAFLEDQRAQGTLDKLLLVVTGDVPFTIPPAHVEAKPAVSGAPSVVGSKLPPKAPPKPVLDSEPLQIPLLVRFPGGAHAGKVVDVVTDPSDVAATVVLALGGSADGLFGRDLALLARGDDDARDAPRLLDDGRGYTFVWGESRLVGVWGKAPQLRFALDDADLRADHPYLYLSAWGLAADARNGWMLARAKGPGREPATIDGATQAALDAWEKPR